MMSGRDDEGRARPDGPGSHPSGHAASGVDGASRFDPSRGTVRFHDLAGIINDACNDLLAGSTDDESYVALQALNALAHVLRRRMADMPLACEPMIPDEEGWSEWIHPLPGYLMQCCDCGLIHEMEFCIGERDGDGPLNEGESDEGGVILFRARRHTKEPPC